MTTIQLLRAGLHVSKSIEHCEWKIQTFVERDAYVAYDYWITQLGLPPDVVCREHLQAINNAMRARAPLAPWQALIGQRVAELEEVPSHVDLITSPQLEVDTAIHATAQLTRRITTQPGVTDMAVSKVFYLLRPNFVAISDSYVRLCLGVLDARIAEPLNSGAFCAIRMERVLRGMRELGLQNVEALDELHAFSNQLAPVVPKTGPFKGVAVPVRLSRVRILDILLWTDVALHGSSPNPAWRAYYEDEFGPRAHPLPSKPVQATPIVPEAAEISLDQAGITRFTDDDSGYLKWLSANPTGLVVNCARRPGASYLKLHRATCWTINGTPARGRTWTGPYIKVCSQHRGTLADWAEATLGGELDPCPLCGP